MSVFGILYLLIEKENQAMFENEAQYPDVSCERKLLSFFSSNFL